MNTNDSNQGSSANEKSAADRPFLKRWISGHELSPEERRAVLEDLFVFGKSNQVPFLIRQSVLLVLSTVIATAGLISDSAAVVIGAMLVAPLMNPVMAAAGAVIMGWPHRFYQSLALLAAMAVGALVISSLLTLVSPELFIMPEQVLARTRPTFWDLLIALAAGSAGAYTITRKESSAIPGVAVAVALLPPLASTGILLTTGEGELALRALILFLTNFVAMVLAGAVTFAAVGVSPARARRESAAFIKAKIGLFFVLTLAICIPLWFYSEKVLFNAEYRAARSELLQNWLRKNDLELVDVEIYRETRRLVLSLTGPSPPTTSIEELYSAIMDQFELSGVDDFRIDYTWTQRITGTWPTTEKSVSEAATSMQDAVTDIFFKNWVWERTDFDQGRTTTPDADDTFSVVFEPDGKVEARANCGRLRGKVSYARRSLEVEFESMGNVFRRKCRKDPAFQLFIGDLEMVRELEVEGENMRLILRDGTAVMTFKR
jgi:uncharacterized hydrophobic protein (TIGR00341 family)